MSEKERMKIESEKQVEYLFARFHHLLGFERVLNFQSEFPDVIAIKDREKKRIELEYEVGRIVVHYIFYKDAKYWPTFTFENGQWIIHYNGKNEVFDCNGEEENLYVENWPPYCKENYTYQFLKRKSIKPVLDTVVYWEGDYIPQCIKEDPRGDELELINIREKLEELDQSW